MNYKNILISLTLLLLISFQAYSYSINMERIYDSDSYQLLYLEENKNEFIRRNHNTYEDLMLREREMINIQRVEDICENIHLGRNNFIYNPIEANNCFYLNILQLSARSAVKLINLNIGESNFYNAAYYYGILRTISPLDNRGARNFITNKLSNEEFEDYYKQGLYSIFNQELINNKEDFNRNEIVSFNYLEDNLDAKNQRILNYFKNDNMEAFVNYMREETTNGNQLLLLAQSNNTNRISEYCFQLSDFYTAYNCLSYIIQKRKNNDSAINRMAYLLNNQLERNTFTTQEIAVVFGFAHKDTIARRLFLNYLDNEIEKIEELMFYYNKGRMLRLNYEKVEE